MAFDGPSQWPAGGHVPMGLKRKADKKDKKKNKKKDSTSKIVKLRPSQLIKIFVATVRRGAGLVSLLV